MRSGEIPLGGELGVSRLIVRLKRIAWTLRKTGAGLMLLACVGVGYIYLPLAGAIIRYKINNLRSSIFNLQLTFKLPRAEPAKIEVEQERVGWEVPDRDFSINIPKISARSRVIENVNAGVEREYLAALKNGVASAAGLSYPGRIGTTYLFAHSTNSPVNYARYNAVFYLLDKLVAGDTVELVYKDRLYKYVVRSTEVLSARDTRYLVPQQEEEILVLQTCYPPGTSWKRLVVVAVPG